MVEMTRKSPLGVGNSPFSRPEGGGREMFGFWGVFSEEGGFCFVFGWRILI